MFPDIPHYYWSPFNFQALGQCGRAKKSAKTVGNYIANELKTAGREKRKAGKDLFNYLNPPTITVISFCCNEYR